MDFLTSTSCLLQGVKNLRCMFKSPWFLGHLQMNLICLRNHLFSILRLHFYCHPTMDHSSWPYSKKEIMITRRTMSHHLLGDPVCDLKDLPPLRLQDGRGFSIVLCRGAISIRLGPRHTSMAKDVGLDVFFVLPPVRPTITRQQDGRRVCGLFPMEGLEFQGFFFCDLEALPKKYDDFSNFPTWSRFFLELTIIDRRLRGPHIHPIFLVRRNLLAPPFPPWTESPRSCRKLSRQLDYDLAFTFQEMYLGIFWRFWNWSNFRCQDTDLNLNGSKR